MHKANARTEAIDWWIVLLFFNHKHYFIVKKFDTFEFWTHASSYWFVGLLEGKKNKTTMLTQVLKSVNGSIFKK